MRAQKVTQLSRLVERAIETEAIEKVLGIGTGTAAVEQDQAVGLSRKISHSGRLSGLPLAEEAADAPDAAVCVLTGAVDSFPFFPFCQSVAIARGARIASVTRSAVPSSVSFKGRYRSRIGFQARATRCASLSSSSQKSPYLLPRKKKGSVAIS